jgi:hypothetical protein
LSALPPEKMTVVTKPRSAYLRAALLIIKDGPDFFNAICVTQLVIC